MTPVRRSDNVSRLRFPRPTTRLWLLPLPLLMAACDGALTLYGQSDLYWSGHRHDSNEGNPQFDWLLRQHPALFAAALGAWAVALAGLILVLPRRLALWLWLGAAAGHAWGMTTWLRFLWPGQAYWPSLGVWVALSGVAVLCWDRSDGGGQRRR